MSESWFAESALISNRTPVLLHGGLEDERRRWALEAASHFPDEGPLVEVRLPEELSRALELTRGVVYLPDVLKLGERAQAELALNLFTRDEGPKWVVGLVGTPEAARARFALREDLHYRLRRANVDLGAPAVRASLEARRATPAPVPAPPAEDAAPSRAPRPRAKAGPRGATG